MIRCGHSLGHIRRSAIRTGPNLARGRRAAHAPSPLRSSPDAVTSRRAATKEEAAEGVRIRVIPPDLLPKNLTPSQEYLRWRQTSLLPLCKDHIQSVHAILKGEVEPVHYEEVRASLLGSLPVEGPLPDPPEEAVEVPLSKVDPLPEIPPRTTDPWAGWPSQEYNEKVKQFSATASQITFLHAGWPALLDRGYSVDPDIEIDEGDVDEDDIFASLAIGTEKGALQQETTSQPKNSTHQAVPVWKKKKRKASEEEEDPDPDEEEDWALITTNDTEEQFGIHTMRYKPGRWPVFNWQKENFLLFDIWCALEHLLPEVDFLGRALSARLMMESIWPQLPDSIQGEYRRIGTASVRSWITTVTSQLAKEDLYFRKLGGKMGKPEGTDQPKRPKSAYQLFKTHKWARMKEDPSNTLVYKQAHGVLKEKWLELVASGESLAWEEEADAHKEGYQLKTAITDFLPHLASSDCAISKQDIGLEGFGGKKDKLELVTRSAKDALAKSVGGILPNSQVAFMSGVDGAEPLRLKVKKKAKSPVPPNPKTPTP